MSAPLDDTDEEYPLAVEAPFYVECLQLLHLS